MNRIACWHWLLAVCAFLTPCALLAQAPPEPWVSEISSPQYFAVFVEDVDRSVTWYRTALGLEELGGSAAEDGSWRIENLGSEQFLVELIRDDRTEVVDRARGFRKVGFRVPDVETVADRVARATGDRPRVLDFPRLKLRIIQIRDPDGNIIQLSSLLEPATSGG